MATPLTQVEVKIMTCSLKSRHRELKFMLNECPKLGEAVVNVQSNSVACRDEISLKALDGFKLQLIAKPDNYLAIIHKHAAQFFGENTDVSLSICHATRELYVMHVDETKSELLSLRNLLHANVVKLEKCDFKPTDLKLQLTSN